MGLIYLISVISEVYKIGLSEKLSICEKGVVGGITILGGDNFMGIRFGDLEGLGDLELSSRGWDAWSNRFNGIDWLILIRG